MDITDIHLTSYFIGLVVGMFMGHTNHDALSALFEMIGEKISPFLPKRKYTFDVTYIVRPKGAVITSALEDIDNLPIPETEKIKMKYEAFTPKPVTQTLTSWFPISEKKKESFKKKTYSLITKFFEERIKETEFNGKLHYEVVEKQPEVLN